MSQGKPEANRWNRWTQWRKRLSNYNVHWRNFIVDSCKTLLEILKNKGHYTDAGVLWYAVVLGRITRLARPSVRSSVRPVEARLVTRKQWNAEKWHVQWWKYKLGGPERLCL